MQEVVVTGSRIIQTSANSQQPVSIIDRAAIDRTGLASIGDLLQQVTAGGKALNTRFNSSGNFGYPADGGGIGAGSAQVDLRNLGSKRVLVLVDGIRWVNESSASGVSGAADLNTIPDQHHRSHRGARGRRLGHLRLGRDCRRGQHHHAQEFRWRRGQCLPRRIRSWRTDHRGQSHAGRRRRTIPRTVRRELLRPGRDQFGRLGVNLLSPKPNAGLAAGSSGTPQGRYTFCDPARPAASYGSCSASQEFFYDLTLNNGTTTPVWNPADPSSGSYHDWSGADRFNYAPYNLLLTPSKRKSMFARVDFNITDNVNIYAKGSVQQPRVAQPGCPRAHLRGSVCR